MCHLHLSLEKPLDALRDYIIELPYTLINIDELGFSMVDSSGCFIVCRSCSSTRARSPIPDTYIYIYICSEVATEPPICSIRKKYNTQRYHLQKMKYNL